MTYETNYMSLFYELFRYRALSRHFLWILSTQTYPWD